MKMDGSGHWMIRQSPMKTYTSGLTRAVPGRLPSWGPRWVESVRNVQVCGVCVPDIFTVCFGYPAYYFASDVLLFLVRFLFSTYVAVS